MKKNIMVSKKDIPNFAQFPSKNDESILKDMLCVVGIPVDSVPPLRVGTSDGPKEIRRMVGSILDCYRESPSNTIIDIETNKKYRFIGENAGFDFGDVDESYMLYKKNMDSLKLLVSEINSKGGIPILLGGDSRISESIISNPDLYCSNTGIIIFSNSLSFPNLVDEESTELLTLLSQIENVKKVMIIGLNGYVSKIQMNDLDRITAQVITAEEIYENEIKYISGKINEFVSQCENIICSIDMAVVDTGFAAGTPVLNIGGLKPEHLINLSNGIEIGNKLTAVSLTNVAPSLDNRNHTQYIAAQTILNVINSFILKEVFD